MIIEYSVITLNIYNGIYDDVVVVDDDDDDDDDDVNQSHETISIKAPLFE